MFRGILKRFLKPGVAVPTVVAITFTTTNVQAGHGAGVTIASASWDGATLSANGMAEESPPAGPVELVDADTLAVIGTDIKVKGNHRLQISTSTCASNVFAVQDGQSSFIIEVAGANCGGGVTQPPVAGQGRGAW